MILRDQASPLDLLQTNLLINTINGHLVSSLVLAYWTTVIWTTARVTLCIPLGNIILLFLIFISFSRSQIKRQKMIYHCKFGEFGVMEGQFTEPSGVAVNAQGDIIVADTNNHRIQVIT